jgi:protein TonB
MVESMPEFVGGQNGLNAFILASLHYPELAKESGISGTVFVSFKVDKKGNVSEVKVLRGIVAGCDEEAIRIIKLTAGKWKPGRQNGKTVSVLMNIPIQFTIK